MSDKNKQALALNIMASLRIELSGGAYAYQRPSIVQGDQIIAALKNEENPDIDLKKIRELIFDMEDFSSMAEKYQKEHHSDMGYRCRKMLEKLDSLEKTIKKKG